MCPMGVANGSCCRASRSHTPRSALGSSGAYSHCLSPQDGLGGSDLFGGEPFPRGLLLEELPLKCPQDTESVHEKARSINVVTFAQAGTVHSQTGFLMPAVSAMRRP